MPSNSVGFKGFAKPHKIAADAAKGMLENVSSDEYVLWTGGNYSRRRASGRSACLNTITEKMKPVKLSDYVSRCLTAAESGKSGFPTSIAIGGLSLHQVAKPAVYLYLTRDAEGNFRARKDIPTPDASISEKPIKAGDIVLSAGGEARRPARKAGRKAGASA